MDYRIRRDRSSLGRGTLFGSQRGRSMGGWLVGLSAVVLTVVALVLWQFSAVQLALLGALGVAPTATPGAVEYAQRGDRAFWRGELDVAIASYRAALQQRPQDVGIAFELVRMLIYHSNEDARFVVDLDEALKAAQTVSAAVPDGPRVRTMLCMAQVSAELYEEATRTCSGALDVNPQDEIAMAYLATAYEATLRYDEAFQTARQAVTLNTESIDANTVYATLLFARREYDAAYVHYKKASDINPRLIFPYFNLAFVTRTMANVLGDPRKFDEAISAYNTILSINRRTVKAYIRLCQTYLNSGEYNRASDNCITATDLDQDSTEAWRMLGEVRYRLSQYSDAITAFAACYERERDVPPGRRQTQCWTYHGLSYVLLQRCAEGLPLLYDVLIWSNDADAVRLANIGLDRCGGTAPPAAVSPTPTALAAPGNSRSG